MSGAAQGENDGHNRLLCKDGTWFRQGINGGGDSRRACCGAVTTFSSKIQSICGMYATHRNVLRLLFPIPGHPRRSSCRRSLRIGFELRRVSPRNDVSFPLSVSSRVLARFEIPLSRLPNPSSFCSQLLPHGCDRPLGTIHSSTSSFPNVVRSSLGGQPTVQCVRAVSRLFEKNGLLYG